MHRGYISIYRKLQDNPLWTAEKFTKGQAWVDLLMLTNHEEGMFFLRGIEIIVKPNFIAWSEEKLATRWKWSRNKVRNFLKYLETKQQVKQHRSPILNQIEILNYEDYQKKTRKKQEKNSKKTLKKQEKNTNNNDNNDNNDNKSIVIQIKTFEDYLFEKLKINTKQKKDIEFLFKKFSLEDLKKAIDNFAYYQKGSGKRNYSFGKNWTKFYEQIGIWMDLEEIEKLIIKESGRSLFNQNSNIVSDEKNTGYDMIDDPNSEIDLIKEKIKAKQKMVDDFKKSGGFENGGKTLIEKYNGIKRQIQDLNEEINILEEVL